MAVDRSSALYRRARTVIPGGTQTISKRPERYVPGWPAYWDTTEGSRLRDIDGNEYIDYVMALGPIVLGYNHPAVTAAIEDQLRKGSVCSLQSPLEVEVAEKLIEHIPCAEMARFFKTGAEATAAAVRIARAYTGRDVVLSCGYAGWHDWWTAKTGESGVPEAYARYIVDVPFNDAQALESIAAEHGSDVACIMIEPKAVEVTGDFLRAARQVSDHIGAALVFDEVVTGFRMGLGGAQGYFGVTPDLATFGKAMANGMPLSVTVGRRELMHLAGDLWITSTFGGEALSLAAAKATITELERPETLERLWEQGAKLSQGWKELAGQCVHVEVEGLPPMPWLKRVDASGAVDEAADRAFVKAMLGAGILTRVNHPAFVTAALTDEEIERTLEASARALAIVVEGVK